MDYKTAMVRLIARLLDGVIIRKILSAFLLVGACMSSCADERCIGGNEALLEELEHSLGRSIKEARIWKSKSGRITSITAFTGPVAEYLCFCENKNSDDVRVPSYQALLKAFDSRTLPRDATYMGMMENGRIQDEEKAYVAVYEGGDESKALIILTKSKVNYSVELTVMLTYQPVGMSLFSQLEQNSEMNTEVTYEPSYLGQYDGWQIYVCLDGGVNGNYMTRRKDSAAYSQCEVIREELLLEIHDKNGAEFFPFIIKCMDYKLEFIDSVAD